MTELNGLLDHVLGSNQREIIYWRIYKKLIEARGDPKILAAPLESAIYNCAIEKATKEKIECSWDNEIFIFVYSAFASKILKWLDLKKSVSQLLPLIDNPEKLEKEIQKATYEFDSEKTSRIQSLINYRQNVDTVRKLSIEVCRKCNKQQVEMDEQQRKSCDEAATFRFRCLNCGNMWGK